MSDVAWKAGDRWYLVTDRSPREMGREPMAVYYRTEGRRFQYATNSRPKGARVLE